MKLLVLIVLLVASEANAQRVISRGMTPRGGRIAQAANRSGFFPLGLFPYYDESPSASDTPVAPWLRPIGTLLSPPAPPPQPLMIELQGDRYVRVASNDDSGMRMIVPDSAGGTLSNAPKSTAQHQLDQGQLDPVILIFRDGRRENVFDYTIADGTLYAHADFYVDGSWSKKIALSSLNLPDTIEANHSLGVNFRLPRSPNEIIVRP